MEALLNESNKELMRRAILKHEATFKQQVNELHRLYQIQKILTEGVEKSRYRNREGEEICFGRVDGCNNSEEVQKEVEDGESNNGGSGIIDESEIELSLGPSSSCPEKRKKREAGGGFRYNPNPPPVSLLRRQATK